MTAEPVPSTDAGIQAPPDPRLRAALDELRAIIRRHYPEVRFRLTRGLDDPTIVELVAIIDVDDPDRLLDIVIDRQMQFQIEEGLLIFVVTERPPERVAAMLAAGEATRTPAHPPV